MGFRVQGNLSGDLVIWELDGNDVEFTLTEFRELMSGITAAGLFQHLDYARPALARELRGLQANQEFIPDESAQERAEREKELEYALEQCLYGLEQKLELRSR